MRAVAIGGGHGLARTLRALRLLAAETTAVVTVADDGGSSGRLRRDLGVAPPGDLRMALAALAENERLASLLQYRFGSGELEGHSLGNLIIVAMSDLAAGDGLIAALDILCEELGVLGRVLPCTTTPLVLSGEGPAGPLAGQVAVATQGPPRRIWIEPSSPDATPEAVQAIGAADLIVLGPGSVFTSILPNLLVPGIGDAVRASGAPVVLVANLREQLGETQGMTLSQHVDALVEHVPGLHLDAVVAHRGGRPSGGGEPLGAEGLQGHAAVTTLVTDDLLDGVDGHDPEALAGALRTVIRATDDVVRPAADTSA